MTKKELFKGKIVELFKSILPNNTIDDDSLEILPSDNHTTLQSLLDYLNQSDTPPVAVIHQDNATQLVYLNITLICPEDFHSIRLFYNSEVDIHIQHPEYIELQQLAEFIIQLDTEIVHWQMSWKYFHKLEMLKLSKSIQLDERSNRLVSTITYPFDDRKIEWQRREFYNIQASQLFIQNGLFDYVYQKTEDMIIERCQAHGLIADIDLWREKFDNVLKQKELAYLIAEEQKKATIRKNTKLRHLISLGQSRIQAAIDANTYVPEFRVSVKSPYFHLTSTDASLQKARYTIHIVLNGKEDIPLNFPYTIIGSMTGKLVQMLKELNSMMPEMEDELQKVSDKYELCYNLCYNNRTARNYPLYLRPLRSVKSWFTMEYHIIQAPDCPTWQVVTHFNTIINNFIHEANQCIA